MPPNQPLVSIGLPVRNGEAVIDRTLRSVLAQDHDNLELIISDNASSDGTEEICRGYASRDPRVRFHRQRANIGLLANFRWVMASARGTFFKWIGDDDWLEPGYIARCLQPFTEDSRLILVTSEQLFTGVDGQAQASRYAGCQLASDDPVQRFAELLRICTAGHLVVDPLYGLMQREVIAAIPRRNMLHEDQIFAAKMALAGPWGHVPELLAHRGWRYDPPRTLARRLGVPAWQARADSVLQCRELLCYLQRAPLTPAQRRRASAAVAQLYFRRHLLRARRGGRKFVVLTKASACGRILTRSGK